MISWARIAPNTQLDIKGPVHSVRVFDWEKLEAVICNADSTIASFEEQLVVGVQKAQQPQPSRDAARGPLERGDDFLIHSEGIVSSSRRRKERSGAGKTPPNVSISCSFKLQGSDEDLLHSTFEVHHHSAQGIFCPVATLHGTFACVVRDVHILHALHHISPSKGIQLRSGVEGAVFYDVVPLCADIPQLKGHWFSQLALLFSENFLGHCTLAVGQVWLAQRCCIAL
mmetsp:Transcript_73358/g.162003  ORF Transcript_73358/g.162003 Transcript_73358/m.162003 type:complete len:227 (+) Transcript_73358:107-787(+)